MLFLWDWDIILIFSVVFSDQKVQNNMWSLSQPTAMVFSQHETEGMCCMFRGVG